MLLGDDPCFFCLFAARYTVRKAIGFLGSLQPTGYDTLTPIGVTKTHLVKALKFTDRMQLGGKALYGAVGPGALENVIVKKTMLTPAMKEEINILHDVFIRH